jgi:hypothetical protein
MVSDYRRRLRSGEGGPGADGHLTRRPRPEVIVAAGVAQVETCPTAPLVVAGPAHNGGSAEPVSDEEHDLRRQTCFCGALGSLMRVPSRLISAGTTERGRPVRLRDPHEKARPTSLTGFRCQISSISRRGLDRAAEADTGACSGAATFSSEGDPSMFNCGMP